MILRHQTRQEATRALHSSLSELQELSDERWFEDELERRAIDETLTYVGFGLPVPSSAAHEAWAAYQDTLLAPPPEGTDLPPGTMSPQRRATAEADDRRFRSWHNRIGRAERAWRAAWRHWVREASRGSANDDRPSNNDLIEQQDDV
jgi:hypothetical protein